MDSFLEVKDLLLKVSLMNGNLDDSLHTSSRMHSSQNGMQQILENIQHERDIQASHDDEET